jgi:hypothetical protein
MATTKKKNITIKADKDSRPKGKRANVAKWIRKANRRDYLDNNEVARKLNQLKALRKGKNVMLVIRNINTNETNKKFIRVNARDVWPGATRTYVMKLKD